MFDNNSSSILRRQFFNDLMIVSNIDHLDLHVFEPNKALIRYVYSKQQFLMCMGKLQLLLLLLLYVALGNLTQRDGLAIDAIARHVRVYTC